MIQIDFTKLTKVSWWFERSPSSSGWGLTAMVVISGILLLLAVVASLTKANHPTAKMWKGRLVNYLWTCALVGFLLVFSRWQQLPGISSRVLSGAVFVVALVWLVWIIVWRIRQYPVEYGYFKRQKTYEKYLPKNNRNIKSE